MNIVTAAQTVLTLLILLIALDFLIRGIKSRQFHNVDDFKYRIFDQNKNSGREDDKYRENRNEHYLSYSYCLCNGNIAGAT
jgi:hypothetical protein